MAQAGHVLLAAALAGAWFGCLAAALAAVRATPRLLRLARLSIAVAAGAAAAATGLLLWGFVGNDWSLVAVVDHSREALGVWDRAMGLWGGMAGSLLLFTALVAVFAAVAVRGVHPVAVAVAGGVVGALVAVTWAFADPFATLEIPALDGVGLTPILEHWAMRIHPPMVYAGTTMLVVPAVVTLGALADRRLDDRWWRRVHPWLVASWALLGAGMLLGAMWAYAELGWGGYWAWDPVENAALLPWLAVTLALHTGPGHRPRLSALAVVLPFLVALVGATLTRSGATSSVHAFAQARDIGLALTALLLVVAAVAAVLALRATRSTGAEPRSQDRVQVAARIVVGLVLVVVLAGTLYPVFRGWLGGDRLAVQSRFFSDLVAPLAVVGLAMLMARGRWPSVWASSTVLVVAGALVALGWREPLPVLLASLAAGALVVSVRGLVRSRRPAELAHAGMALMLIGIAGTATGARAVESVPVGASMEVGGHTVELRAVDTEPGPTEGSTAVVATVVVDGDQRRAALVAHPDRGVLLAESTLRSTPLVDVQVILRDASADGALLVVNVSPLQQLVWLGGALVVLGGAAGAVVGRQAPSEGPRRRRLDSSSESRVEAG